MKRTNNPLLLLLLLVWLAGGCTQTEVEEKDIPPHALKDVEAVFNLRVKASQTSPTRSATAPGDTIQTRAEADLQPGRDSEIAGIWIGQYNAQGNLLYHYYNGALKDNTLNVKLKQNPAGDDSYSYVWFVANSGDLGEIATETALKEHLLPFQSDRGLPESNLSMKGMWSGQVKEEGNKKITVELTRLVAKITFTYTINGSANSFSFTPSSITLNSVPDKSQIEAPATQLSPEKLTYTTYTEEVGSGGNSRTFYWYLPENMAGDGDKVESEKKKTGKGVKNATYIELAGTAVQGGVTYKDVVFRFYPGNDQNNYNIVRNSHYTMNVTLVGIDITDERITVGNIPPIEVTEGNMPAEKGGTKDVQITARPGQEWVLNLKDWLMAIIDGKEAGTGAQVTWQGPAKVTFQSTEANSKAEPREADFSVKVGDTTQEITITQNGSTLAKGENIMLEAASGSEGASSFTATKGVKWRVDKGADSWWNWVAADQVISGAEATGEEQPLNIKATASNPSSHQRSGTITVKAGESVGDPNYDKLKQEITITQAGSTLTGSTQTVAAEASESLTASFSATSGLEWTAITNGSWITLTSMGGETTGSAQTLTYKVKVNPTSSERNGAITVRAGNEDDGPKGTITVTQAAASLAANVDKANLAATANDSGTLTYQATAGLPLSITAPDWLNLTGEVLGTTTGSEQTIEYKTSDLNLYDTDKSGNILVQAGEIIQNVAVKQAASVFRVINPTEKIIAKGGETTGSVIATAGLAWTIDTGTDSNISVTPTQGEGDEILTFTAAGNAGSERTSLFTVSVSGTNPVRSEKVTVKQAAGTITTNQIIINSKVVESYQSLTVDYTSYPPFDYDGIDRHGESLNCKLDKDYWIEVENKEDGQTINYQNAVNYCTSKDGDWRVPTLIELQAIYDNTATLQNNGCDKFSGIYWSSSIHTGIETRRCRFSYNSLSYGWDPIGSTNKVRCVRDI